MRSILRALGLMSAGALCARIAHSQPKALNVAHPVKVEGWKGCSVANALAKQFARAGGLMNELDNFVAEGRMVFRICDAETLDCNHAPQPFEPCHMDVKLQPSHRVVKTEWSPRGVPVERKASYVVVLRHQTPSEVVFTWDLHYRFSGSQMPGDTGPGVLAGVSEVSDDAPTVKVAIAKGKAIQTQSSAILFGEQSIE